MSNGQKSWGARVRAWVPDAPGFLRGNDTALKRGSRQGSERNRLADRLRRANSKLPIVALSLAAGVSAAGVVVISSHLNILVLPAILLVALGVGTLALLRPMWVLYGAIACVPLETFSLAVGGALSLSPSQVLFIAAGFGWLANTLVRGRSFPAPTPLVLSLGLLVAAVIPGFLVAEDTISVLKVFVVWLAFALCALMVLAEGDQRVVQNILIALALAGGLAGAIAIGKPPDPRAGGRAAGTLLHPNAVGLFLAMSMTAQIVLALRGPRRLRPVMIAALGISVVALTATLSRGAFLAAATALALMCFWAPLRRAAVVLAVALFALSFLGANPLAPAIKTDQIVQRFQKLGDSSDESNSARRQLYGKIPEMAKDHPLVGVGAGNFVKASPHYGLSYRSGASIDHGHSVFFTAVVELGILGLGALLWVVGALVLELSRILRRSHGERRVLGFALAGAFTAFAVQGLFSGALTTSALTGTLFALVGCTGALGSSARWVRQPDSKTPPSGDSSPSIPFPPTPEGRVSPTPQPARM